MSEPCAATYAVVCTKGNNAAARASLRHLSTTSKTKGIDWAAIPFVYFLYKSVVYPLINSGFETISGKAHLSASII